MTTTTELARLLEANHRRQVRIFAVLAVVALLQLALLAVLVASL